MEDERITLAEAARIAHRAHVTLRQAANRESLRTEKVGEGPRATYYTTRAWLQDYLDSRWNRKTKERQP